MKKIIFEEDDKKYIFYQDVFFEVMEKQIDVFCEDIIKKNQAIYNLNEKKNKISSTLISYFMYEGAYYSAMSSIYGTNFWHDRPHLWPPPEKAFDIKKEVLKKYNIEDYFEEVL